jgi:hypothetical protein
MISWISSIYLASNRVKQMKVFQSSPANWVSHLQKQPLIHSSFLMHSKPDRSETKEMIGAASSIHLTTNKSKQTKHFQMKPAIRLPNIRQQNKLELPV